MTRAGWKILQNLLNDANLIRLSLFPTVIKTILPPTFQYSDPHSPLCTYKRTKFPNKHRKSIWVNQATIVQSVYSCTFLKYCTSNGQARIKQMFVRCKEKIKKMRVERLQIALLFFIDGYVLNLFCTIFSSMANFNLNQTIFLQKIVYNKEMKSICLNKRLHSIDYLWDCTRQIY